MNAYQRLAVAIGMLLLSTHIAAETLLWDSGPYTYDGSGNVALITSPTADLRSSFRYDRLNRVAGSTIGPAVETFTYDAFGNLIGSNRTGLNPRPVSTPVDLNNHLFDPASPDRFKYDEAGNLINENYGAVTYNYDALNMMTSKQWTGSAETYIYTPSDERIGVRVGSSGTDWHWILRDETGKELREYQQTSDDPATPWTWIEDHVYRDNLPLGAQRPADKGGQIEFHLDHLGTPRLITNLQGAIVSRNTYSPFGIEYTDIGQMQRGGADRDEPLKFTGHHRDFMGAAVVQNESYLDYMHARYYESLWGRFLSVDPIEHLGRAMHNPQMWNRYTYVLNNPLVLTDPTGTTVYLVTYTMGNSEADEELKRAAQTRAAEIQKGKFYDAKTDTVLVMGVTTKADFAAAVGKANGLSKEFGKVGEIDLYSHSGRDGPVFHSNGRTEQLTANEIGGLRVNWEFNAVARFYGCNTGMNFTGMFANAQHVPTYGNGRYAYFSGSALERAPISPTGPVYMISAPGFHNPGPLGVDWVNYVTGFRMADPVVERP